ncbi:MAG: hypothetical protein QM528_01145 [Phycisphaerales bacterium]|nr:hypothetical protein [Phycisphaerales bacterium]
MFTLDKDMKLNIPYYHTVFFIVLFVSCAKVTVTKFPYSNDIIYAVGGDGLLTGSNGLIFRSTSGGETWSTQSIGDNTAVYTGIDFANNSTIGYISGYDFVNNPNYCAILKTTDGVNWNNISPIGPVYGKLQAIQVLTPDTVITVGASLNNQALILKTYDGGITWNNVTPSFFINVTITAINFWNNQQGVITIKNQNNNSGIFKTIDGGNNWTDISPATIPPGTYYNDIRFINDTTIFAVGTNSIVLKSTKSGNSWQTTAITPNQYILNSISFISPTVGFIATRLDNNQSSGALLETTDGGATWLPINPISSIVGLNKVVVSASNNAVYCAGLQGYFYVGRLNFSLWNSINYFSTGVLNDLYIATQKPN